MDPTSVLRLRPFHILVPLVLVGFLHGTAAAGQIGFVYALQQVNAGANLIHGFRFDQTTGALTLLPGFPVSGGGAGSMASASEQLAYVDGRLFVVNDGDDTLTVFSVNHSTGALTAMPFSPVALGAGNWRCVAVHPSGSPVVVGNSVGGLSSFVVSSVSATAAPGSPFSTSPATPTSCRFSQVGDYAYTGGANGTAIAGFSVNAGTGVLTALAGSPFDSGASFPLGYATDSSGRLFSANFGTTNIRAFTTSAGVPTAVTGNPFASGISGGIHGVLHPGGFYMVADRTGNRVGVYQIAGTGASTTMTAVAGSPFASGGTFTAAVALTSNGAHLLAANSATRNLTVYQVNQSTGALSTLSTQAVNALGATGNISGLAFAPGEAGFVYSLTQVSGGANQIYGFRLNPNTGALTLLPGFPVASGGNGTMAATAEYMAYLNGRLYVLNDGSATVSAFKVNRTTGALTALPFSPIAVAPAGGLGCVAVHPSGSPVVVGYLVGFGGVGASGIDSVVVGATTATLAPGGPFATGGRVSYSCRFSQDGSYVYTGGVGTTIAGLSVNTGTGVLTPLPGSPFASGGLELHSNFASYATDSSGRLFTAGIVSPYDLRAFTTASGIPTAVSGNPFATTGLFQPFHGVLHPNGFYMVASRNGANVASFQIAGTGAATTLTAVAGSPFSANGSLTSALAVTPDGSYLVAANALTRNLTVFQVNPATGILTFVGVQPANTLGATGLLTGIVFAPVVPPFIDDPMPALTSVIKAVHITDLRSRIDGVRAQYGLGPYTYTDSTLTVASTQVRVAHVTDLRAALNAVYVALGMAPPVYTDPTLGVGTTVVKLAHITQLRAAVLAIE